MVDRIICYCNGVSENTILGAIRSGATTLKAIQESTSACTGNQCKELNPSGYCCSGDIIALIKSGV
ncbi:MAG: (2Fe-2S)-binding protein [Desulfobacteraceae bacterium]|jgi:bacterioferritin-associated ferredoxin|nr:(2Fe-2S)-binding protein [Desulfobacteraceae bacterium]